MGRCKEVQIWRDPRDLRRGIFSSNMFWMDESLNSVEFGHMNHNRMMFEDMSETADSHRNSQQHQEENFILPVVIAVEVAVAIAVVVVVVRSSTNNSSTVVPSLKLAFSPLKLGRAQKDSSFQLSIFRRENVSFREGSCCCCFWSNLNWSCSYQAEEGSEPTLGYERVSAPKLSLYDVPRCIYMYFWSPFQFPLQRGVHNSTQGTWKGD